MGLDMYLTRKIYFGGEYEHNNISFGNLKENEEKLTIKQELINYQAKEVVKTKTISLSTKDISKIESIIGYWRKANAIHKWFVDNIQDGNDDCNEYIVPKSLLTQRLYTVVRDVLKNREMAETILPTTGGFFFGSTNYDYYYFNDLEYTKSVLEKIMQDKDCLYYYYQSSW